IPYSSCRTFATFFFLVTSIAFCLSAYLLLFLPPSQNVSQNQTVSISQSSPSPSEKPSGTQPIERSLRDLDAQWAKAAGAKDVEQTMASYSDVAIVSTPNANGVATKETITQT